jgi:hypothetical protein
MPVTVQEEGRDTDHDPCATHGHHDARGAVTVTGGAYMNHTGRLAHSTRRPGVTPRCPELEPGPARRPATVVKHPSADHRPPGPQRLAHKHLSRGRHPRTVTCRIVTRRNDQESEGPAVALHRRRRHNPGPGQQGAAVDGAAAMPGPPLWAAGRRRGAPAAASYLALGNGAAQAPLSRPVASTSRPSSADVRPRPASAPTQSSEWPRGSDHSIPMLLTVGQQRLRIHLRVGVVLAPCPASDIWNR